MTPGGGEAELLVCLFDCLCILPDLVGSYTGHSLMACV